MQVGHVLRRPAPRPEEVDELHRAHRAHVERRAAHTQHACRELFASHLVHRLLAVFHAAERLDEIRQVVAGEREQRVERAAVDAQALDHLAPRLPARRRALERAVDPAGERVDVDRLLHEVDGA